MSTKQWVVVAPLSIDTVNKVEEKMKLVDIRPLVQSEGPIGVMVVFRL